MARNRIPDNTAECPSCHRRVGVQQEFDMGQTPAKVAGRYGKKDPGFWRIAMHGKPTCIGSRNRVPAEVITFRRSVVQ